MVRILRTVAVAGLLSALLAACGGGGTVKTTCAAPTTDCDGVCAKLDSDTSNCGACANRCAAQQTCNSGVCTNCPTGELPCNSACIDVQNDVANCGGCGIACGATERCDRGACVADGLTVCAVSNGTVTAKDLKTDPQNCGSCGNVCGANLPVCLSGLCTPSCTGTGRLCEADPSGSGAPVLTCVDTAADSAHCGSCSNRCAAQQTCTLGTCTDCPSGQLQCAGATPGTTACRPVLSDSANCGGCDVSCSAGSRCDNGVCVSQNLTNCGALADGGVGTFDLQNDPQHCGACGNVCQSREVCRAGNCAACADQSCGNRCVDTRTDPANCGACGAVCSATNACIAGSCAAPISIRVLPPVSGGAVAPSSTYTTAIEVTSVYPTLYARVDLAGAGSTTLNFISVSNVNGYYLSTWNASSLTSGAAGTSQSLTFVARDALYAQDGGTQPEHEAQATATVLAQAIPSVAPTLTFLESDGGTLAAGSYRGVNTPAVTLVATTSDVNTTDVEFRAGGAPVISAPVSGGKAQATVQPSALTSLDQQLTACAVNPAGTGTCSAGVALNVGNYPAAASANSHAITVDAQSGRVTAWFVSGGSLIAYPTDYVGTSLPPPVTGAPTNVLQVLSPDGVKLFALRADGVWSVDCAAGACTSTQVVNAPTGATFSGFLAATTKAMVLQASTGFFGAALAGGSSPPFFVGLIAQVQGTFSNGGLLVFGSTAAANSSNLIVIHPALAGGQTSLVTNQASVFGVNSTTRGDFAFRYVDASNNTFLQAASFDGTTLKKTPVLATGGGPILPFTFARPGQMLGEVNTTAGNQLAPVNLNVNTGTAAFLSTTASVFINVPRGRGSIAVPFIVSDDQQKAVYATDAGGGLQTLWLLDLVTGTASQIRTADFTATSSGRPVFVHSLAGLNLTTDSTPAGAIAPTPAFYWMESVVGSSPPTARVFYQRYGAGPGPVGTPVEVNRLALVNRGPLDEIFASSTSGQLFFQSPNGSGMDLVAVKLDGSSSADIVADNAVGFVGREEAGGIVVGQADGRLSIGRLSGTVPVSAGVLTTVAYDLSTLPANVNGLAAPPFGILPDMRRAYAVTSGSYLSGLGAAVGVLRIVDLPTNAAQNAGEVAYALGTALSIGSAGQTVLALGHNGNVPALFERDLSTGVLKDRTGLATSPLSLSQGVLTAPSWTGPFRQYCMAGGTGFALDSAGIITSLKSASVTFTGQLDALGQKSEFVMARPNQGPPALYFIPLQSQDPVSVVVSNLSGYTAFGNASRRSPDDKVLGLDVNVANPAFSIAAKLPLPGVARTTGTSIR